MRSDIVSSSMIKLGGGRFKLGNPGAPHPLLETPIDVYKTCTIVHTVDLEIFVLGNFHMINFRRNDPLPR